MLMLVLIIFTIIIVVVKEMFPQKINEHGEVEQNYLGDFIQIGTVICLCCVLYFYALNYAEFELEKRGQFGDSFGALNSLFSGLAFAGIIITIIMQMKELELTRRELKKSANAQDETQKALNEQLKSMELSSKIDNLHKYIEIERNTENKEAAKKIIQNLVSKVFTLDEHAELFKPKLITSTKPSRWRPDGRGDLYGYRIFLRPEANTLYIHEVVIPENIETWLQNPTGEIGNTFDSSKTFTIEFMSKDSKFNFKFRYSSPLTNRVYNQSIEIYVNDRNSVESIIGKSEQESYLK